jgi:hypothetical protein
MVLCGKGNLEEGHGDAATSMLLCSTMRFLFFATMYWLATANIRHGTNKMKGHAQKSHVQIIGLMFFYVYV